jgi:hypothetical protein
MFRPVPAIIRFSSETVSVFIRSMRLCNDGEISSSVALIITIIETVAAGGSNVGIVLTWGVVLTVGIVLTGGVVLTVGIVLTGGVVLTVGIVLTWGVVLP